MEFKVGKDFHGTLVRDFLTEHLGLSRRCISLLKNNEQGIVLDGKRVTVRAVLAEGSLLSLALEDGFTKAEPVDIPIDVIYEDEALIVVNKPFGMPTILSHGHNDDTLANALTYRYRDREFIMRAVNRLDRDTSGICLVAKERRSAYILCSQMQRREIGKRYLALLDGIFLTDSSKQTTIVKNIKRKDGSTIEREVCKEPLGERAETVFSLYAHGNRYSAVIAEPKTGRTHQLRVHFSSIGYPILGDTMYGQGVSEISRQALHAAYLSFVHPYTKEKMSFFADIPQDISAVAENDGIDLSELKKFFEHSVRLPGAQIL